jgi:hypothetical protein
VGKAMVILPQMDGINHQNMGGLLLLYPNDEAVTTMNHSKSAIFVLFGHVQ